MLTAEKQSSEEQTADVFEDEAADLLHDMISMLFPEDDDPCEVRWVKGSRLVTFVVKPKSKFIAGMVLGKKGRTIEAIRSYFFVLGRTNNRLFNIEFQQPDER